jgi:hypothetical protein
MNLRREPIPWNGSYKHDRADQKASLQLLRDSWPLHEKLAQNE